MDEMAEWPSTVEVAEWPFSSKTMPMLVTVKDLS